MLVQNSKHFLFPNSCKFCIIALLACFKTKFPRVSDPKAKKSPGQIYSVSPLYIFDPPRPRNNVAMEDANGTGLDAITKHVPE